MVHAPSCNNVLPVDPGNHFSVVDIRCLRLECAIAPDRRGDKGTKFVEPGRYSLVVAPCGHKLYRFCPVRLVIVAMFGIGVAQHSGFIDACIRKGLRNQRHNPWRIVLSVIVLGLLSNVVGDAGYIILLPIAATLFHSVGLHP